LHARIAGKIVAHSLDAGDVAESALRFQAKERKLMKRWPRRRFWIEAGLGALSATLFVLTLFVPDWIEAVSRIDPDQHSGSLEWVIVAALVVTTVVSSLLARREWRRTALGLSRTR